MCAPLFASLYLIPEDLGLISRDLLMVLIWVLFGIFELYRIRTKMPIMGLREYEYERPSASFWMATAFLPMILFFPLDYALPLLIGFGFVDPLIGVLRKSGSGLYPFLPFLVYLTIMAVSLSVSYGLTFKIALLSFVVTASAITAESVRSKIVDDDFLMLFVPLVALWLLGELLI